MLVLRNSCTDLYLSSFHLKFVNKDHSAVQVLVLRRLAFILIAPVLLSCTASQEADKAGSRRSIRRQRESVQRFQQVPPHRLHWPLVRPVQHQHLLWTGCPLHDSLRPPSRKVSGALGEVDALAVSTETSKPNAMHENLAFFQTESPPACRPTRRWVFDVIPHRSDMLGHPSLPGQRRRPPLRH